MSGAQHANAQGTVGQTLKSLREARNLALADIAARLRLDPRVIAAIESGDHDSLPSALYVRGYVRGYARLLGTDPEHLVGLYNEEAPSPPPEIVPEMSRPSQTSSDDTPVRAATLIVVVMLGVLLVVWWQNTYRVAPRMVADAAPVPAQEPAAAAPQPQSQLPYSYTVVTHPTATFYQAPDPGPELATGTNPGAAVVPATGTAPVAAAGSAAAVPAGPDALLFRAQTDSWLEVTDRSGERIYMDFIHGGESLSLTGQAPFDVIIGYAIGIAVEFNGKAFDPAPYTRAGVARFSLGQ